MGRLGSGLIRGGAIITLLLVLSGGSASAVGIGLGIEFSTLDLRFAFTKVAPTAQGAFDRVHRALVDLGLSQDDLDDADELFEDGLSGIEDAIARFPSLLPIPHLGLSVDLPLRLIVIDDLRLSAGFVSDSILYALADRFGLELPPLRFDEGFEFDGNTGSIAGSVVFSSLILATDAVKRLELLVFAVDLGGGVHLVSGALRPDIDVEGTPGLQEGLEAALDSLYLEGLSWTSFGFHLGGGIEIGPPLLRISARVGFAVELLRSSGYWDLRPGRFIGTLGMVIRF